jgi:hypothetical protein
MRIYLRKNYREIVLGDINRIVRVQADTLIPDIPRFFIEGNEKDHILLEKLNLLEQEIPQEPTIKKNLQNDEMPAPELPKRGDESYFCSKHKREHKQGTASYVACWESNFGKKEKE